MLALKVVFGKLLPVPKLCKKKLAQCAAMMTGTVCFEEKNYYLQCKIWGFGGQRPQTALQIIWTCNLPNETDRRSVPNYSKTIHNMRQSSRGTFQHSTN